MKCNLTVLLIIAIAFSSSVSATELSWSERFRPWLERVLGKKRTDKYFSSGEQSESKWVMPKLPEFSRKATDITVYQKNNSELRLQGQEYSLLPLEKRRPFEISYIKEINEATKRKPIAEKDLSHWLNVLENGGSREGVYRGIVLDGEYATLEAVGENLSDKSVSWMNDFSKQFLGLAFKEEDLKKGNIYILKKHIAEKSLEMMDLLEDKPDDLRMWYALFSVKCTENTKAINGNEIRFNNDPEVHYDWAKKVPLQHIKSEFLIKFHSVVNYLQKI